MKKIFLLAMIAALAVGAQAQNKAWQDEDLAQRHQLLRMGDWSAAFWSTTSSWHDGESCYFMQPANAAATKMTLTRIEMPGYVEKETLTIKRKGERATCKGKEVTHETLGTWDMLVFRDGRGNIQNVLLRVDNGREAMQEGLDRDAQVLSGGYPGVDGRFGFVSVRPLTKGILKNCSTEDLRLMQWEVYARHGAPIPDPRYWDYFNSLPWYENRENGKVLFSDVERFNISLIKTIEAER